MFLPLVNRAGSRDSRVLVPVFDLCGDLSNSPSSRRVVSFSVITKLELSNTCWLLAFPSSPPACFNIASCFAFHRLLLDLVASPPSLSLLPSLPSSLPSPSSLCRKILYEHFSQSSSSSPCPP